MSDGYVNLPVVGGGGGGGTNQDLSNLTSPTAINQSLLFGAESFNIGAAGANRPLRGYFKTAVVIGNTATPITIDVGEGTGTNNIRIGFDSLTGDGVQNTVVGDEVQVPHGNRNTCFGYNSGPAAAYAASGLTSVGANCGNGTTGASNTYIGSNVVSAVVSSGYQNAFVGNSAGAQLTSGYNNVLVGFNAGQILASGLENVMIGAGSGSSTDVDTYQNTFVGVRSGFGNGNSNTYIGFQAGYQAQGSNNTFVGNTAGSTGYGVGALTGNANILLGYQCTPSTADASFECVLGGTYKFYFYNSLQNVHDDQRPIDLFFAGVKGLNTPVDNGSVSFWAPQGTGTGRGGDFTFNVAPAGSSSSDNNAWVPVFKLDNAGPVTIGNASLLSEHLINTAVTTSATAGSHGALPLQVAGYLQITVNGTTQRIPYYNA